MEIHVVWIGENNLHKTKGVRWPRLLPHHQMARFQSLQHFWADRIFGHYLAFCRDHLKVMFGDVIRIPLDMRDDFVPCSHNHVSRIARLCGVSMDVTRHVPTLEALFEDIHAIGSVAILPS